MSNIITGVIGLLVTIIVGLIGFFIKRSVFNTMDVFEKKIEELTKENTAAHKEIWIEIRESSKEFGERIAKIEGGK